MMIAIREDQSRNDAQTDVIMEMRNAVLNLNVRMMFRMSAKLTLTAADHASHAKMGNTAMPMMIA